MRKGSHHTEESKQQMGKSHLGSHHTEESKQQIRKSHLGRHHTEESKQQMSVTRRLKFSCGLLFHSEESNQRRSETMKGRPKSDAMKQKLSENMRDQVGELNRNWQGGISSEEYGPEFNKKLKTQIRERDSNTCQLCGGNGSNNGRLPDVHHIDYDKKNNNPWNLITLCMRCHGLTNGKRKYWTLFFQKLQMDRRFQAQNEEIEIVIRPKL